MDGPEPLRFFFIHVMKTGGATFRQHILASFPKHEVYPWDGSPEDFVGANLKIGNLTALPPDRLKALRVITGHFPYVASEMIDFRGIRMTILRHPLTRTISYLKHCKRHHPQHRDLSLEQIYDDRFYFNTMILNHQSKLFSMAAADRPNSVMDVVAVDDRRLETAKQNLSKVDVIGLTERHDAFVAEVKRRFGWPQGTARKQRVGREPWEVPDDLRQQILADNAFDLRFYEYAVRLCDERAAASG